MSLLTKGKSMCSFFQSIGNLTCQDELRNKKNCQRTWEFCSGVVEKLDLGNFLSKHSVRLLIFSDQNFLTSTESLFLCSVSTLYVHYIVYRTLIQIIFTIDCCTVAQQFIVYYSIYILKQQQSMEVTTIFSRCGPNLEEVYEPRKCFSSSGSSP